MENGVIQVATLLHHCLGLSRSTRAQLPESVRHCRSNIKKGTLMIINKFISRQIRSLFKRTEEGKAIYENSWQLAGHFYSPVPSKEELKSDNIRLYPEQVQTSIHGIDLNIDSQLDLVKIFDSHQAENPLFQKPNIPMRYHAPNEMFSLSDANVLYSMLRHFKPLKVIEIGSGYSSALILDIKELFLNNNLQTTFVDPFPERLIGLLRPEDKTSVTIIPKRMQDIPLSSFDSLENGDFLFIDSTHVCKTGSDVCYLLFDVLPRLKSGVFIHIHDIFFPFEYPKQWTLVEGRGWNEIYVLRAFLTNNTKYEIIFFSSCLACLHPVKVFEEVRLLSPEDHGQSIWIRKT